MSPSARSDKGKAVHATSSKRTDGKGEAMTEDASSDSSGEGKIYVGSVISQEQLYMLDWEQIRRLVQRCDYWWRESMDDDDVMIRTPSAQAILVSADLQKLYTRIDQHQGKRIEFVRQLGDHILHKIEGPHGLGSTTKAEFEGTVMAVLLQLDIQIEVEDFEYFTVLRGINEARKRAEKDHEKDHDRRKEKRTNTVIKIKPSLSLLRTGNPRLMSNMAEEDSEGARAGAQSSKRVSR
ncbi:hypothetical protein BDZ85DRAFT_255343 [Elsinoe ampelina]|uniref:Uncharacterized protein n=1 Tax=Elsinoe ampelina TaxID=302913 RepID=A0A6A6GQM6_9PEZI|nr:hypothetical protein BDZ85DRAFT_255343 [Elsinoe ampelina]